MGLYPTLLLSQASSFPPKEVAFPMLEKPLLLKESSTLGEWNGRIQARLEGETTQTLG